LESEREKRMQRVGRSGSGSVPKPAVVQAQQAVPPQQQQQQSRGGGFLDNLQRIRENYIQ
jgi:hypothetical protein